MGRTTAVWCVCLACGSAIGQVVTPPPGAPEPKPEYVRPAVAPVIPQQLKAQPKRPDVSGIEFESLAETGDDGMIVRLSEPADFAALRNNPLVGPEQMAKLDPWKIERREAMEQLAIKNMDSAIEIDFGIIDEIHSDQQEQFAVIMELIRPLSITTAVGDVLREEELLSPEQAELNNTIALDYRGKVIEEIQQNYAPEPRDESSAVDMILRYVFWENAQEPLLAYRGLLIEAAPQMDGWMNELGVDEDSASAISALVGGYDEGMDNKETLKLMRKVVDQLETAQVRSMLEMTIAARKDSGE